MLDLKNSKYFNSLSDRVKESVKQCFKEFKNEDDLKKFVTNIDEYKGENESF